MDTLRELDLVRAVPARVELRAAGETGSDTLGTMTGHFSVFDSWYRIRSFWEGDFMEQVAPGAFRKTMDERREQIVVAFDHGYDPVIGDKVLGPIDDLREDGTGAYYEVGLLDTSYNRDLLPALKRGLYGSSFRFQVIKDEWNDEPGASDHNPDGVPERTIKEVRLYEFGPVTYPANPAATAGMRSMSGMTDEYYERLRSRSPQVEDLLARARALRTPEVGAAAGTPGGGAAPVAVEPVVDHSRGLSASARSRLLELPFLTVGASHESA